MPERNPDENPPLPEPSVGDPDTSPVSEAEVTENGFPSTNDANDQSEEQPEADSDDEN